MTTRWPPLRLRRVQGSADPAPRTVAETGGTAQHTGGTGLSLEALADVVPTVAALVIEPDRGGSADEAFVSAALDDLAAGGARLVTRVEPEPGAADGATGDTTGSAWHAHGLVIADLGAAAPGDVGSTLAAGIATRWATEVMGVPHRSVAELQRALLGARRVDRLRRLCADGQAELIARLGELVMAATGGDLPLRPVDQVRALCCRLEQVHGAGTGSWSLLVSAEPTPRHPGEGAAFVYERHPVTGADEAHILFGPLQTPTELEAGIPGSALTLGPGDANTSMLSHRSIAMLLELWRCREAWGADGPGLRRLTVAVAADAVAVSRSSFCSQSVNVAVARAEALAAAGDQRWRDIVVELDVQAVERLCSSRLELVAAPRSSLATGIGVAPGVCVGRAAYSLDEVRQLGEGGDPAVYVGRSPGPAAVQAVLAAAGSMFETGGHTSHTAVIARGSGKPCVMSAVVEERPVPRSWVTVDGTNGRLHAGRLDVRAVAPPAERQQAVAALLERCDQVSHLEVWCNADTAAEAAIGFEAGARGVGLCRLEHAVVRREGLRVAFVDALMAALELAPDVEDLVRARWQRRRWGPGPGSTAAVSAAERRLAADSTFAQYHRMLDRFEQLLTDAMAALYSTAGQRPVVIRLLDPPLAEFLDEPAAGTAPHRIIALSQQDTLLGLRGVRLSLITPDLTIAQLRAILGAAHLAGRDAPVDILVPLVADPYELDAVAELAALATRDLEPSAARYRLGAMIETPRAALRAAELARSAEFMSIGTNDLTQATWAMGRDSAQSMVLNHAAYELQGIDPFASYDRDGVGTLVALAVEGARAARPDISIGVCGQHAAEPAGIASFDHLGIDYVSCPPQDVVATRLRTARIRLTGSEPSVVTARRPTAHMAASTGRDVRARFAQIGLLTRDELQHEPLKWLKYLVMDRVGLERISGVAAQVNRFSMTRLSEAEEWCRNRHTKGDEGALVVAKVVPWGQGAQLANYRMTSSDDVDRTFRLIERDHRGADHELWCCDSSIGQSGLNLGGRLTYPAPGRHQTLELVWHASPRLLEHVSLPEFSHPYLRATRAPDGAPFEVGTVHVPAASGQAAIDPEVMLADLAAVLIQLQLRTPAMAALTQILRAIGANEICFCFKVSDEQLTVIDWDTEIESSAP